MEANQQKILGYFIEEAKEHLETLERGILELSSVARDTERVNEMFRAAHSLKGGAAMLGYSSIQNTAHRLEDAFKVVRENPLIVDQQLESLFLAGYDILQDLIEQLQGPFSLQDGKAEAILERGEPIFKELQDYLQQALSGHPQTVLDGVHSPAETQLGWGDQVRDFLRQMLQIFKEDATPDSRQQLQSLVYQLSQLAPQEEGWQSLLKAVEAGIANPQHSYQMLAPIVIQQLKQGSDFLELGQGELIAPSPGLQRLAAAKLPQVLVTLEPTALANTLRQVFDQQQVSQLVELLS